MIEGECVSREEGDGLESESWDDTITTESALTFELLTAKMSQHI